MANGTGEIVDIRLSPDNKKLLIKVAGAVSLRESFVTANSKLLALDFEAAGFANVSPITRYENGPIKMIQIDTRGASQRIFVDFRGPVAPDYRVKRMGDFFMVFMDEEDIIRAQSSAPPTGQDRSKSYGNRIAVKSDPGSKVSVLSADVKGDVICLEVVDNEKPSKAYKVTLSIDFDTMGFNRASVSRLTRDLPSRGKRVDSRKRHRGKNPRPADPSVRGGKQKAIRINVASSGKGLFNPSAKRFLGGRIDEARLVGSSGHPRLAGDYK
jgi:hypothetical protein